MTVGVTLREDQNNIKQRKTKTKSELRYYTEDEAKILIKAATQTYMNGSPVYRLGYIVPFAIHTGLRLSELLGLKWHNVDFENKIIHIRDTVVQIIDRSKNPKSKMKILDQIDITKSYSGQRSLHLNDTAFDAIKHLHDETGHTKYVFITKTGKPPDPCVIETLIRKIAIRAEFPKEKQFGMHALRHTFASILFAKGVDVQVVSKLLGHSTIQITRETYIHLIEGQEKKAINFINF